MISDSLVSAIDKLQLRPQADQEEVAALILGYLEGDFTLSGEISESSFVILESIEDTLSRCLGNCEYN